MKGQFLFNRYVILLLIIMVLTLIAVKGENSEVLFAMVVVAVTFCPTMAPKGKGMENLKLLVLSIFPSTSAHMDNPAFKSPTAFCNCSHIDLTFYEVCAVAQFIYPCHHYVVVTLRD